ncbi:MAG: hypothetical protein OXF79_24770 [Chloroflexi bacterium]|nr:hypothetical protein [Chloroflexota bacterium]
MLRTVEGRSLRNSDTNRGLVREGLPAIELHAAVASAATSRPLTARAPVGADVHDHRDDDGDGAPTNVAADIVRQFAFPRWTARLTCTLGVSAVADDDQRCDASPDIGAAMPERLGITSPAVRDDNDDRSTALTMIASLCASSRLPSGQPSPARRGRTTTCRRQSSLRSMKAGP